MKVMDGDRYVLIASKGGRPVNPHWYHNLKADPNVEVRDKTQVYSMTVREVEDEEEYQRLLDYFPGSEFYDKARNSLKQLSSQ